MEIVVTDHHSATNTCEFLTTSGRSRGYSLWKFAEKRTMSEQNYTLGLKRLDLRYKSDCSILRYYCYSII